MNKKIKVFSLGLGLIGFALMAPESGKAAGPCVNCHTMHNSQNGTFIVGNPTAQDALINKPGGCVGCHSGTNTGGTAATNAVPFVLQATEPVATGSLAGGNFYWVATAGGADDTTGHNVVGISGTDASNTGSATVTTPPGWNATFDDNGLLNNGGANWGANQLTCAGTRGCHGLHEDGGGPITSDYTSISGGHHADDTTIDGNSVGTSFRFLYGILGTEDPEWEYTPTAALHNQYYGDIRADDLLTGVDAQSINYLCAECHGNFHSGAGALGTTSNDTDVSPWIRHPTDIDMNDAGVGGEFAGYGGAGNAYVPLVPVASDDVSVVLPDVLDIAGDAIVSCISCHRAHGSEWPDLLRWDYDACIVGSGDADCGCFACHTEKD